GGLQPLATAQRVAGSSADILCGSVGGDRSNPPRSPGIAGDTHVRYGRFASPLGRLKPITRRPIPQVSLGLHSRVLGHNDQFSPTWWPVFQVSISGRPTVSPSA